MEIEHHPDVADLPVLDSLPALRAALAERGDAVLQAAPGAGKSTVVPLALLNEPWAPNRRILMLEPRRIAAKSVAHRMAELLGETVGRTVGYRIRLETRVSAETRIEVVTEGVLTRMLLTDPGLADVALLIFDEFHERSLDAGLALALTLAGRELFREDDPLRLLMMSATLDVEGVAALLGGVPVIASEGRQYPVDIRQGAAFRPRERIAESVVPAILDALRTHPASSLLVFLPGQAEIRRVAVALEGRSGDAEMRPLYGAQDLEAQRSAIAPAVGRKVVLATNIAETSLTIEGVDVVIDGGFVRQATFDPNSGMNRLELRRIARDAAEQRAGRAGRLRSGVRYRLWSAPQHERLAQNTEPEILSADLADLALQLLAWGVGDPAELTWLDPPPRGAWQQALDLLKTLGALRLDTATPALTEDGEAMAKLGAHPRIGRLLLEGARFGVPEQAARIAALLEERDPFGREHADLEHRLAVLGGSSDCPREARGPIIYTCWCSMAPTPGSTAGRGSIKPLRTPPQLPRRVTGRFRGSMALPRKCKARCGRLLFQIAGAQHFPRRRVEPHRPLQVVLDPLEFLLDGRVRGAQVLWPHSRQSHDRFPLERRLLTEACLHPRQDVAFEVQHLIGQQVVFDHRLLSDTQRVQDQRTAEPGAVLARGAVDQEAAVLDVQQRLEHARVVLAVMPCQFLVDGHHERDPVRQRHIPLLELRSHGDDAAGIDGDLHPARSVHREWRELVVPFLRTTQIVWTRRSSTNARWAASVSPVSEPDRYSLLRRAPDGRPRWCSRRSREGSRRLGGRGYVPACGGLLGLDCLEREPS